MKLTIKLDNSTKVGVGVEDQIDLHREINRWPSQFPHSKKEKK